ncbi:uncharacterized protein LOC135846184 [Planococcus citri]
MVKTKRNQSPPFSPSKVDLSMNTVSEIVQAASSAVLLPEISKFTGEVSATEAKEWLKSVENQGLIGGWNNLQKLETAKRLLTKAAKSWYLLNADDIKSWSDFRSCFWETFIGEDDGNVVDKWERFSARCQQDNESSIEYIFDKLRLAKDVGASVAESKNAVCAGFKSEDMANYLRIYDYSKAADWSKRLREFESSKSKPDVAESENEKPVVPDPETKKSESVLLVNTALGVDREKYVKTAVINGKTISGALIDNGSSVCVMRASTAVTLCETIQPPSNTRIFGVGNLENGSEVLGKIVGTVSVDGVAVPETEILILRDNALPVPLVIGCSWIENPNVAMIKWKDQFIITQANRVSLNENSVVFSAEKSPCNIVETSVNFVRVENAGKIAEKSEIRVRNRKRKRKPVREKSFIVSDKRDNCRFCFSEENCTISPELRSPKFRKKCVNRCVEDNTHCRMAECGKPHG